MLEAYEDDNGFEADPDCVINPNEDATGLCLCVMLRVSFSIREQPLINQGL